MEPHRRSLVRAWESSQVELHGRYSSTRVLALAKYARETSWLRALLVLVATPLPCLIVMLLHAARPSVRGAETNKWFFLREYYAYLVMTFLALHQFRTGVQVLPYALGKVIRDTFVVSAFTVAVIYDLTLAIGFPLPFTILTAMGVWAGLTVAAWRFNGPRSFEPPRERA